MSKKGIISYALEIVVDMKLNELVLLISSAVIIIIITSIGNSSKVRSKLLQADLPISLVSAHFFKVSVY